MRIFLVLVLTVVFAAASHAQWDIKVDTTIGKYRFKSTVDTSEFTTTLTISKGKKKIFSETYYEYVYSVQAESFKKGGEVYYFINFYSGGAHCCSSLILGKIVDDSFLDNDKFVKLDSSFYGNSGFILEDLDSDGVKEILSGNDMLAYAFTNYAETRFPLRVEGFDGKKLKDITGKFKDMLRGEIEEFTKDLDELIKEGFECPAEDGEDTFNTDAGSVKTILAAIVADYYSLGEVEKGYELVDKVYKCIDRESYKRILKSDFKLK